MAMKQQVVTLVVAYDYDTTKPPADWDWRYEMNSSSMAKVTEFREPTDYDGDHPRWRMGASRVTGV